MNIQVRDACTALNSWSSGPRERGGVFCNKCAEEWDTRVGLLRLATRNSSACFHVTLNPPPRLLNSNSCFKRGICLRCTNELCLSNTDYTSCITVAQFRKEWLIHIRTVSRWFGRNPWPSASLLISCFRAAWGKTGQGWHANQKVFKPLACVHCNCCSDMWWKRVYRSRICHW